MKQPYELSVEELREEIEKRPKNGLLRYQIAKKLFSNPLEKLENLEEIKRELKESIKLAPRLYMAHYYLGRVYFALHNYEDAEKEFREVLKIKSDSILAKEYVAKCLALKPKTEMKDAGIRAIFYLFENNIRQFIEERLKEAFGQDWWRGGVPGRIRGNCAKRREEGFEDESSLSLLYFADFHDYKDIIEANRRVFAQHFDNKEWQKRFVELEPIRNAIAHNRPLPKEAEQKVTKYFNEFQRLCKKS